MKLSHAKQSRHRKPRSFSAAIFRFGMLSLCLLGAGCAQTLRSRYIDANDPCSVSREPIVTAGDELDARQRQVAHMQASQQMQGHELPVVTGYGSNMQFNFGNALQNAIAENSLADQNYMRMKQQETGANAAALLASVEGDAGNDLGRMRNVTNAMQSLRACRANQIALARTGSGPADADRLDRLRKQQVKLNEDDQLIAVVFGQYGTRAQMYADAVQQIGVAEPVRVGRGRAARHASRASPARTPVETLRDDQRMAQVADRKQSETLHETLQNSIAGA